MARESGVLEMTELERALYSVDEDVICEYFQRGELWTTQAPPVLLAAATLQVMLSNSHMAYRECYSKAVKLLEYIHSECPKAGLDEDYIDLLVDLKTKAALYEVLQEAELTDELKQNVLTKYLGNTSTQEKMTYTSLQEYSVALYTRARRGLEDILASEQECLAFRRTHLFNSDNSRMLSASLLSVLTRYLTAVRKHLQTLSLTHYTQPHDESEGDGASDSSENDERPADLCDNTESISEHVRHHPATDNTQNSSKQNKDKASNDSAETSALHGIRVLRSRANRRGSKRRQGTRAVATAATVSATSEEEDNGSDEVPVQSGGVYHNLWQRRSRRRLRWDPSSETESNSEDKSWEMLGRRGQRVNKRIGSDEEEHVEETNHCSKKTGSDISSGSGSASSNKMSRRAYHSLSPPNVIRSVAQNVSVYATPPRASVRLAQKRSGEGKKVRLRNRTYRKPHIASQLEEQRGARSVRIRQANQVEVSSIGTDRGVEPQETRYQLRQRGKHLCESETTGPSEGEGIATVAPLVRGMKRKKQSSEVSESSESCVQEQRSASKSRWSLSRKPQPKRQVIFYESTDSSVEGSDDASEQLGAQWQTDERNEQSGSTTDSSLRRSRRKQVTPQKLGQKLESKVHFSKSSHDKGSPETVSAASKMSTPPVSVAGRLQRTRFVRRSSSPRRKGINNTRSQHAVTQSSDSDNEHKTDEATPSRTRARTGHTRPLRQPPHTSTSSCRVINLADNCIEQSQPSSQWDYVAVQTVAAAATLTQPVAGSPVAGRGRLMRVQEIESGDEGLSIVKCSNDE